MINNNYLIDNSVINNVFYHSNFYCKKFIIRDRDQLESIVFIVGTRCNYHL